MSYRHRGAVPPGAIGWVILAAVVTPFVIKGAKPLMRKLAEGLEKFGEKLRAESEEPSVAAAAAKAEEAPTAAAAKADAPAAAKAAPKKAAKPKARPAKKATTRKATAT